MSRTGKVIVATTSAVAFLIGAALLTGAGALAWLYGTHRSPDGFLTSPTVTMTTEGYAITSSSFDIEGISEEWLGAEIVGTFRAEVQSADGGPLFVGIGPRDEVEDYLDRVAHIEVTHFGSDQRITFYEHPGSQAPTPPVDQDFWMVSSEGDGSLTMDWVPQSGSWAFVAMNADGTPVVDVEASLGLDTPWVLGGMIALGVLGLMTMAVAIALGLIAFPRQRPPVPDPQTLEKVHA